VSRYQTIFEALAALVHALGVKRVVAEMWPTRDDSQGRTYLLHCLDPERAEKLGLDEFMWLLRAGARAGMHDVVEYIAHECLYDVRPVAPAEAQAELAQAMDRTVERMADLLRRYEQVRQMTST
jgi:hypothetical protein